MFCVSCGKEINNDMNFCPYCGAPVVRNEQPDFNYGYNYNNPDYGYNPSSVKDVPSVGFNALSFFFPIVGLILYLIWKDETPVKAKAIGKWALISVILGVVLYIVVIIAVFCLSAYTSYAAFSYFM